MTSIRGEERFNTAVALWSRLRVAAVGVQVVDGKLKLDAPCGVLTPELVAEVAGCKAELIDFLTPAPPASPRGPLCPSCRRSHRDERGACWKCMMRPCVSCGRNTGSALVGLCATCGFRSNGHAGGWADN